ncbi:hypothetical protein FA13DRAFT_1712347 [Coprinellus micaceus]|uniref:Uncharacterized protein n=1 Tax=Coprinellus micaceus TaxID=71717 RepID=A0A4Y7T0Z4_COPMI|nr:hypothetical protein FA13DRAFT_1712347 [Coprinellus micaceus]
MRLVPDVSGDDRLAYWVKQKKVAREGGGSRIFSRTRRAFSEDGWDSPVLDCSSNPGAREQVSILPGSSLSPVSGVGPGSLQKYMREHPRDPYTHSSEGKTQAYRGPGRQRRVSTSNIIPWEREHDTDSNRFIGVALSDGYGGKGIVLPPCARIAPSTPSTLHPARLAMKLIPFLLSHGPSLARLSTFLLPPHIHDASKHTEDIRTIPLPVLVVNNVDSDPCSNPSQAASNQQVLLSLDGVLSDVRTLVNPFACWSRVFRPNVALAYDDEELRVAQRWDRLRKKTGWGPVGTGSPDLRDTRPHEQTESPPCNEEDVQEIEVECSIQPVMAAMTSFGIPGDKGSGCLDLRRNERR